MPATQRSRVMDLFEVLSVGLPFSCFKILGGLALTNADGGARSLGMALVGFGAADALVNVINLGGLAIQGRRPMAVCCLALATHALRPRLASSDRWRDVGAAVDVLFSFTLVAVMIGVGGLRTMPASSLLAWNVSVILNVLGAGVGRLAESLRNLSQA